MTTLGNFIITEQFSWTAFLLTPLVRLSPIGWIERLISLISVRTGNDGAIHISHLLLFGFSVGTRNDGVIDISHLLFLQLILYFFVGPTQITFVFYVVCSYALKPSQV